MSLFSLALPSPQLLSINNKNNIPSLYKRTLFSHKHTHFVQHTHHKRTSQMKIKSRGFGPVCYSAPISTQNLQWIATISSAVLMLAKGTAAPKSFLVPLFALQAPLNIVSWIKGEYGTWAAFLALLVRLFYFIPGELELPLTALLLVIVSPYQVMDIRGTQTGTIASLVIAGYLAFQHFSRLGNLQKAFDQGSVIATVAIIFIIAVSCLLLI